MKEDNVKLRRVIAADVKFLRDHKIMDYSLLLSAERYSANTVKQDDGSVIDPETPKHDNSINGGGGTEDFISSSPSLLLREPARRRSRHKTFF